jgi:hypothetical protein
MTKSILNEKGYWKMSYNKRVTVENKIRARSFNWGLRKRAENRGFGWGLEIF